MNFADHGPEATKYLKAFIGDHYAYSDMPVFQALWRNYNECQFVENTGASIVCAFHALTQRASTGDILFYRNKKGEASRRPADKYTQEQKKCS